MNIDYYAELDILFLTFTDCLDNYNKSEILQNYYFDLFISFFYANLIKNIFSNLNKKNILELGLSNQVIIKIENQYKEIIKDVEIEISGNFESEPLFDKNYYENFRNELKEAFPELSKLINGIETEVDFIKSEEYLDKKRKEIKNAGLKSDDLHLFMVTTALEIFISKKGFFPNDDDLDKLFEILGKGTLPEMSKELTKSLIGFSKEMLDEQRDFQRDYENNYIYKQWEEPLDLLECLIRISLESGEKHTNKISNNREDNDYKFISLVHIHSRALQISNEILVLLKAGYPDGANARWRSLYELAVVSFFLLNNEIEVSKRYLEHESIRTFKDAKDYQKYYAQLGDLPLDKKVYESLKNEKERLCEEHGNDFYKDWGWIPKSILSDQHFRALSSYVDLDHLYPYFNLSSASVHGLSRGFNRLGIRDEYQKKILLCGPSNYGLEDPLQNTAISLLQITTCLLRIQSDFESVLSIFTMQNFVEEIGISVAKVQKDIEES